MPRPKRRFLQMKMPTIAAAKQQCCVVCYSEFTPFPTTSDKWESNMIKMFYNVLDIPSMGSSGEDGDGDDEDSIISLPFCPQCHSKISVMSTLRSQLQHIQSQFCTVRNDLAFTIVDTIDKNCRNGPMDFIRQQIYEKWKNKYDDAKRNGDMEIPQGLEKLAGGPPTGNHFVEDFGQTQASPSRAPMFNDRNRGQIERLEQPRPLSLPNGSVASSSNSHQIQHPPQQQQPAKRPARAASMGYSQYLLYSQTTSIAKIRKMEAIAIRESINHEMPKLTPMDSIQGFDQQQQIPQKSRAGLGSNFKPKGLPQKMNSLQKANVQRIQKNHNSAMIEANNDVNAMTEKRRGSTGKRTASFELDYNTVPVKLPKVQTTKSILKGIKNEQPVNIKLKAGRKSKYQPDPGVQSSSLNSSADDQMFNPNDSSLDIKGILPPKTKAIRKRRSFGSVMKSEIGMSGDFPCELCPKIYFNISRLKRHESLCHPSTKSLQCAICPNGFSSMLAYRRHMQNQHHRSLKGAATKTCPFCKKSFVKQTAYDYHVRKHHDRKVKRGRRTRAEPMNLMLDDVEQEPETVDPLLITPEEANENLANETSQGQDELWSMVEPEPLDAPIIPAVRRPKKSVKMFMGGRKSKRRRAAALAAKKRKALALEAESTLETDPLGDNRESVPLHDVKLKSATQVENQTTISETIANMKAESVSQRPSRKVGFKNRFTAPTPPVRKSLRRAESTSVKPELVVDHDQVSDTNSEDKMIYNCTECSKTFSNFDVLTAHLKVHSANGCQDCTNGFASPEELEEHVLSTHTITTSAPADLHSTLVMIDEPEPIEINLELPETDPLALNDDDNNDNAAEPVQPTPTENPTIEQQPKQLSPPIQHEQNPPPPEVQQEQQLPPPPPQQQQEKLPPQEEQKQLPPDQQQEPPPAPPSQEEQELPST